MAKNRHRKRSSKYYSLDQQKNRFRALKITALNVEHFIALANTANYIDIVYRQPNKMEWTEENMNVSDESHTSSTWESLL